MKLGPAILAFFLAAAWPLAGMAEDAVPPSRAAIAFSFAPIVKKTAPAVVNVYARRIERSSRLSPFADDPFFQRFFGGDGFFGAPRDRIENSLGSGVIIDPRGFIVTNNHVIKGSTEVRIVLSDKREFDAKILLADERTDLAVLKVDTRDEALPAIAFGNSDDLQVGDLVLAMGNPFGVGQTVTSGIVSALARTQAGISDYQFFIQTDAPINPGNSGGPLVDMAGRLVGINTAIYSRSGGSIGIGFAIPANMVRVVVQSAENGGKLVRPWIGADMQDVTSEIADSLGLDRPEGALVVSTENDSPLAKAGLKRGDIITSYNGKPIGSAKEFAYRVATTAIGETAEVGYERDGHTSNASMSIIAPPETTPRRETTVAGSSPFSGLKIANLSPAVKDELGLTSGSKGVVVTDVTGGPAARFGFRKGDIIVELNGTKIESVDGFRKALAQDEGYWAFAVNRGGRLLRVQLGG